MTRGQRILLWGATIMALGVGLLLPVYAEATRYRFLDLNRPPTVREKVMGGILGWPGTFVSNATYPLSTLVGVIAAYMVLRSGSRTKF